MNVIKTDIAEVLIFEPKIFGDDRGFFFESFNQKIFEEAVGQQVRFVQDNHSKSCKDVLRGLHFQDVPYAQGKLVRCIAGKVFDVAVDIRKESVTFGQWIGVTLSASNKRQLWIPKGFAHGFLTLEDNTEFVYKTTDFYRPQAEKSIAWNDSKINISWPLSGTPIMSAKDLTAKSMIELFDN